jgi:hypothetical protein
VIVAVNPSSVNLNIATSAVFIYSRHTFRIYGLLDDHGAKFVHDLLAAPFA